MLFSFKCYQQRNLFLSLTTGMEILDEYASEESPFTEQEKLQRETIQEDITTNSLEFLQTVKELKSEMESVKKENERILRAQEELNQILTKRFHAEGRGKRADLEKLVQELV